MDGSVTDDTKPEIRGMGKVGETIEVRINGVAAGRVVVGEDKYWSYTVETPLSDGDYVFTAVAISAGGAESSISNTFSIEIDTVAPDRLVIDTVEDNQGAWKGLLQNGQATDDRTPTFTGKSEPGCELKVFINGDNVDGTVVDEEGNWIYEPDMLDLGEHIFIFYSVDAAGNWSKASEPWTVVVSLTPRSLDKGGEMDGALSVQDLLVEAHDEIAGVPDSSTAAKAVLAPELSIDVDAESGPQDSWASSSAHVEAANAWTPANQIETVQQFEQQLIG